MKIIDFILHVDKYLSAFIQSYGPLTYGLLFLIIFVETGLVIAPFLPGDSLLFVAGTFSARGSLNVFLLFGLLSIAAILGDTINYWLGKFFGEKVFSKFINPKHMEKAKVFYEKHGARTIVLARFIPVIRSFAPFIAGIGKMKYSKFLSYNIIGGITWVGLFVFAGFFFGNLPFVEKDLTRIIFVIIGVSFIPAIIEFIRSRKDL